MFKATLWMMSITKKKVEGLGQWGMLGRKRAGWALVRSWLTWIFLLHGLLLATPASWFLGLRGRKVHAWSDLLLGNLRMLQRSTRNQEVPNSPAGQHPRNSQGSWESQTIAYRPPEEKRSAFETVPCGFPEKSRIHENAVLVGVFVKSGHKIT